MKIAFYSGGKDSTAMMLMIKRMKIPCDVMVFADVGEWDLPENVERVKEVSRHVGIPADIVTLPQTLTHLMLNHEYKKRDGTTEKGYGWPTYTTRWCTRAKCKALADHVKKYRPTVTYIGYNWSEQKRFHGVRSQTDSRRHYPLIDYKVDTLGALRLCRRHGFFLAEEYEYCDDRVSCWCCPFQTLRSYGRMIRKRPDLWARIRLWDLSTRNYFYRADMTIDQLEHRAVTAYDQSLNRDPDECLARSLRCKLHN